MRMGFAEGATSVEALNGWVGSPTLARGRETLPVRGTALGTVLGRDEQLGAVFRQMRAVTGLNEAALARKLGTDVSVIMDLEAGIADGLPAWRELAAIVERLAFVTAVDPSPILTRLMQVSPAASGVEPAIARRPPFAAMPPPMLPGALPVRVPAPPPAVVSGVVTTRPVSAAGGNGVHRSRNADRSATLPVSIAQAPNQSRPVHAPTASSGSVVARGPLPRGRRISRLAGAVVLLGLLLGGYLAMQNLPRFAYQSVGYFPRRLHESVRNIIDLAVLHTSAVKDGLRWIDVGDPRLRKGDRLKSR